MADRGLNADHLTSLGSPHYSINFLVKIELDTPLYYTTGPGSVLFNGNTYIPDAFLTKIPDIVNNLRIRPGSISLVISGASLSTHALTMGSYKNRKVTIYADIRSSGVNGGPVEIFKGKLDSFDSDYEKITLKIVSHWANFEEKRGRILTDEYQQRLFPGDKGLEFISKTINSTEYWGKYRVGTAYSTSQGKFVSGALIPISSPSAIGRDTSRDILNVNTPFAFSDVYADTNRTSSAGKLPVYYGYKENVQGVPCFRFFSGANTEFMHVVYLVSEGEINNFADIKFDVNGEIKSHTDPDISSHVTVFTHTGSDTQVADSILITATSAYGTGEWTASHQLKGIAYIHVRYKYNAKLWTGEPVPLINLNGKLVNTTTQTGIFTSNPVWVLYDYLTNTSFGKGLAVTDLDGTSFETAATYSDQLVTEYTGGGQIPRFAFNGGISTSNSVKQNVENILSMCRGYLVHVGSKYSLVQETHTATSSFSFNDDNFARNTLTVTEGGLRQLANVVYYEFEDKESDEEKSLVIAESAAYLAEDDNEEFRLDVSNRFERNRYRAQHRAETILKRSREQIKVTFESSSGLSLQVVAGDIVDLTDPTRGWVAKTFMVTESTINTSITSDNLTKFTLIEFEPSVFDWTIPAQYIPPNSLNSIDNNVVPFPTTLTANSGTAHLLINSDGTVDSRILVGFTAPTNELVEGYELEYKLTTDTSYNKYPFIEGRTNTSVYISNVTDGKTYNIRVRSKNGLGFTSQWLEGTHTVAGKTAPPGAPSAISETSDEGTVNLSWTDPTDLDFSHTEVWASVTNNRGAAFKIGDSKTAEFNHSTGTAYYYWLRSVDTTGNLSTWFPSNTFGGFLGVPDTVGDLFGGSGVNICHPRYSDFEESAPYTDTNCVAFRTTGDFYGTGASSLRLVSDAGASEDAYVYLGESNTDYNINITPNNKWIVSAWFHPHTASARNWQIFIKTSGGTHYNVIGSVIGDYWHRVSGVLDLSADGSTTAILRVDADLPGSDWSDFDKLMLEEQVGNRGTPSTWVAPVGVAGEAYEYGATSNVLYRQTTAPTGVTTGDIWYDTNDYILYQYLSGSWQLISNSFDSSSQLTDDDLWAQTAIWQSVTGARLPDHIDNVGISVHTTGSEFDQWAKTNGITLLSQGGIQFLATTALTSIGWRYMPNPINTHTFAKDRAFKFSFKSVNAVNCNTTGYSHLWSGSSSAGAGMWMQRIGSTTYFGLASGANGNVTRSASVGFFTDSDVMEIFIEHDSTTPGASQTMTAKKNGAAYGTTRTNTTNIPLGAEPNGIFLLVDLQLATAGTWGIQLEETFTTQDA